MTTYDYDPASFIAARLDEWEAAAQDAILEPEGEYEGGFAPEWRYDDEQVQLYDARGRALTADDGGGAGGLMWPGAGPHIAAHDPARILRQVEAMRDVVMHAENWKETFHTTPKGWTDDTATAYRMAMSFTLSLLAAGWSDHADYPGDAT